MDGTGAGHAGAGEALAWARPDLHRADRTGEPEAVYGAGKTPEQVVELLRRLADAAGRAVLATRLDDAALDAVAAALPGATVDRTARCAVLGPLPTPRGCIAVVAAGTTDLPVAREAVLSAQVAGASTREVVDVGVAGLHRLLDVRPLLADVDAVVVVAGMEGALPSVVAGLVDVPVVAVPTSVGYGASLGGITPLLAMLASCAPGVSVVNIDNGFGGGVAAARVARRSVPR